MIIDIKSELSIKEIREKIELVSQCVLQCKLIEGKKMYKHQGHYYADLIPPNWEQSRKHQQAQQVAHQKILQEGLEYELCPCCQQQIVKNHVGLCEDELVLSFLGSGYPLYFNFIRYSILILGILFMTSGQFTLVSNLMGEDCSTYLIQVQNRSGSIFGTSNKQMVAKRDNRHTLDIFVLNQAENYCMNDFISVSSIANKRFDQVSNEVEDWLNLSSTIVILVIIFFFRKSQLQIDTICDIQENTPPDYTIMCTGFPQVKDPKKDLENFFQQCVPATSDSDEYPEIVITKINLVYFMDEVSEIIQKRQILIEKKQSALSKITHGTDLYYNTMWNFDKQILTKFNDIKTKSLEIANDPLQFSGVAFVSFQKEDHKQYILKKCRLSLKSLVFNCFFGCLVHDHKSINYMNKNVQIRQAPEPTDIIWENIVQGERKRLSLRIFGWCLSKVVVSSFIIILLWSAKKQAQYQSLYLKTTQKTVQSSNGDIVYDQPISSYDHHMFQFLCSLFTVFINSFVVDQLSRFLVKFDAYETYSQFNVSLAQKLALTLFFNSALVAYISCSYYTLNFYGPGGLIYIQIYFFMSNAIVPPIINVIDTNRIQKILYRWWYIRKGNQCTLTQREANLLQEHPEHEIELRYADILKTLFMTCFYAPLIPLGYVISFLALCIYYWVEKVKNLSKNQYVLLRRQSVKHTPSVQLSLMMTEMLEYLPILYTFGNLLFKYQISGYFSLLTLLPIIISCLNAMLPMQYLVDQYFAPEEQDETTTYEQAFPDFQTDYEMQNPITKHLVDENIFEYTKNKLTADQQDNSYRDNYDEIYTEKIVISANSVDKSMKNYGSEKIQLPYV